MVVLGILIMGDLLYFNVIFVVVYDFSILL